MGKISLHYIGQKLVILLHFNMKKVSLEIKGLC